MISLAETWIGEKDKEKIGSLLPDGFYWSVFEGDKINNKGRVMGGWIIGVRKGWGIEVEPKSVKLEEGLIRTDIADKKGDYTIWSVYNKGNLKKILEHVEQVDFNEEKKIVVGGDFNVRIGEMGDFSEWSREEGTFTRKSKDKTIGNGGRLLTEFTENKGWRILNGSTIGDEEGEYTFTGARGSSVIDYAIVNDRMWENICAFRVGNRIESDHNPLEVNFRCFSEGEMFTSVKSKGNSINEVEREILSWDEESIKIYQEKTTQLGRKYADERKGVEKEKESRNDSWVKLSDIIKQSWVKKVIKWKRKKLGYKRWWNRECTKRKRWAKRAFYRWKKGIERKEKYLNARKEWRVICKSREREWSREQMEELKKIKHETQVWKFINKHRKKRDLKGNSIGKEEWVEHFTLLLEGSREKKIGEKREAVDEEEGTLDAREIYQTIKNLRKGKAAGCDGIPNEAWMYGNQEVVGRLIKLIKNIWEGEEIPEEWKTAILVPLHKKGKVSEVKNYRGIALLPTAYKIYTEIIRKRLEKEVEDKGLLPEGQAGFRRGRSTMDNVYILNHLIQKAKREGVKIYALFVDLSAAFDGVNRGKLWKILEEKGISKGLIERLKGVYEETKVKIRTENGLTEEFWTTKGVRQGCVLSPLLFCLYTSGLEEVFRKRNVGGVSIKGDRIWSLSYADDIVILAKNREAMKDMMGSMKVFWGKLELVMNTEKTKMMVFNKNIRCKKEEWKWKGKEEIQEVRTFKYLGFTFNSRGSMANHIADLKKKGIAAAKIVWGLGERICRNDFNRRMMLFNYLVRSVMEYGVEIWGWEEQKVLEKVGMDYVRWILGLDFCTPRYIIQRETGYNSLKIRWGLRAMKFEKKIKDMEETRIIKKCWREKQEKEKEDSLCRIKEVFLNKIGLSTQAVKELEERGRDYMAEIEKRQLDIQKQVMEGKIRDSRYNRRYSSLKVYGIPKYLRTIGQGIDIKTVARLRCGNLEKENKYWEGEERRKCGLCMKNKSTLEHTLVECEKTRGWVKEWGVTVERGESELVKEILKLAMNGNKRVIKFFARFEREARVADKGRETVTD